MNKYAVYPNVPTDLMTTFLGATITPADIFTYATNNIGSAWIEPNSNYDIMVGNTDCLALAFNAPFGTVKNVSFTDLNGNNPYTVQATEFVGGRPPVIRR